jgi:hypothetical protein
MNHSVMFGTRAFCDLYHEPLETNQIGCSQASGDTHPNVIGLEDDRKTVQALSVRALFVVVTSCKLVSGVRLIDQILCPGRFKTHLLVPGTIRWSYEDGGGRNLYASFRFLGNVVCTTQALFQVPKLVIARSAGTCLLAVWW